ncbi:MAG: DNA polymerase III subunit delta, partial [Bacteroidales bacterium]|nr:DNA polymerase III subunit delta [Bacteroidales bacterium]
MTYDQIISDLKQKKYKPVYLLYGDESYFIDKITDYIAANVLNESEKAFNQTIFYGKDTTITNVIQAARRFPMMSEYQVIIVKEAQHLKPLSNFEPYFESPQMQTILVLALKDTDKLDKRIKATKLAEKIGAVLEAKKLYERDMVKWVATLAKSYDLTLSDDAQRLMYEHVGNDLSRLDGEMKKLKNATDGKSLISIDVVANNIGVNRDYNIFELQKALGLKDVAKAYKIVDYFAKNPKSTPIVVSISQLYAYFSKVLKVHYISNRGEIASQLGISPYFVDEYLKVASLYPVQKLVSIVS